jgi:hypothetical protein
MLAGIGLARILASKTAKVPKMASTVATIIDLEAKILEAYYQPK